MNNHKNNKNSFKQVFECSSSNILNKIVIIENLAEDENKSETKNSDYKEIWYWQFIDKHRI